MSDIYEIMMNNIDNAFERGLLTEKQRDEAIDGIIRESEQTLKGTSHGHQQAF